MRRLLSVALIGLAVAGMTAEASAQGRGGRGGRSAGRAGVRDTARMRQMDSVRAARGDTIRRRAPDSLRQRRLDSLRAAGAFDSTRAGRGFGAVMGSGRGALAGIQLNDNEKAAIKTINEKHREEMKQLRDDNQKAAAGQNAELRAQIQGIAERERAEIRGALTAEHQAQFDANIANQSGRGRAGRPGRRPPPSSARRGR